MRLLPALLCLAVIVHSSYAPPVTPDKTHEKDSEVKDDLEEYMEYHRYLREVVQTLENDTEFRERLEKANEDDIRSGKIAEHLDFVNHNVRTKLDEIKRIELERLRALAQKQNVLNQNIELHSKRTATDDHVDHENPYTFEVEDLKKLIQKTTADLEAADKQRKEEFKEYEMQKEFEKNQKLKAMDEAQKKQYIEKEKVEEDAKKHHQPLHHPGSKQQLEEVWEKQDQMDQQFDPKAFFMMHDVDGNGVWDPEEVKALFIKELDKIYGPNGPNKDLHERAEEMERMREHVFDENDKNQDGMIDFNEFMVETQKANFKKDEGWKSIDEKQIYSQAEYDEYQRRRLDEGRYLHSLGLIDMSGRPLPGAERQTHRALEQYRLMKMHGQTMPNSGHIPQVYNVDPAQGYQIPQGVPQGYHQGGPQGYPPQNQVYQQQPQQGYPAQAHPQQGYPPQGHSQQGYQPQGHPQQGYQPQGHPQQGFQPIGHSQQGQQAYPQEYQQQAPNQNAPQGNQVPIERQAQDQKQAPIQAPRQDNQAQQPQALSGNSPVVQNEQHPNPQIVQGQQPHQNPPSVQGEKINSINEIPTADKASKV